MAAGFQSFTDNGLYQLDSDFTSLALVRSGQLYSQQYTNGSTTNTQPTRVEIFLNDGEILAIASTSYASIGSRVGTTTYVHVSAPAGTLIEYYVFAPGTASSNVGLQIFNASGVLTFDSSWKLFNVKALVNNYGSTFLDPGRKYAFVQTMINTSINYQTVVVGQTPNSTVSYFRLTSFSSGRINGSTFESTLGLVDTAATRPSRGDAPPSNVTYNNGVNPQFLILDVTGY